MAVLLESHPEWNLHVGLGLSEGDGVVGAMGARDRMDFTVLGDTVNLASRLCRATPAGSVLVCERVSDALSGSAAFRLAALAPIPLRGVARPVRAFRLFAGAKTGP